MVKTCEICGRKLSITTNYKNHLLTHSGAKPHKCTVCEKSFSEKSNLTKHLLIHSGAKPHKCTVCEKTFTRKSTLDAHSLTHSGAKPHKCTVCEKSFSEKSNLKKHLLIHSGAKPHKCPVRENTFAQKSTLDAHSLIHSGAKPQCQFCGKTFTQKSTLKKHLHTHPETLAAESLPQYQQPSTSSTQPLQQPSQHSPLELPSPSQPRSTWVFVPNTSQLYESQNSDGHKQQNCQQPPQQQLPCQSQHYSYSNHPNTSQDYGQQNSTRCIVRVSDHNPSGSVSTPQQNNQPIYYHQYDNYAQPQYDPQQQYINNNPNAMYHNSHYTQYQQHPQHYDPLTDGHGNVPLPTPTWTISSDREMGIGAISDIYPANAMYGSVGQNNSEGVYQQQQNATRQNQQYSGHHQPQQQP